LFSKIERKPWMARNKILFDINLNTVSFDNVNFNNFVVKIIDFVKDKIPKLHKNIKSDNIMLPYTENKNGDKLLCLKLMEYNKHVLTQVAIHQSKKQGGKIIYVKNGTNNETLEVIRDKMVLLKFPKFGEEHNLYYEGKFSVIPSIEILEVKIGEENRLYCNLVFYVKKMEIKYNVSRVKSIFDGMIIVKNNNRQITLVV